MAEAHEWTLRRLREMAGRLTEQAYLRASAAAGQDDEAHARWMLVFDRMARGLRLSIALEARLARERRRDADEIGRTVSGERVEPRSRRGAAVAPAAEREPREADRDYDEDDGLPADAPLAQRIDRLKSIIEGAGALGPAPPRPGAEPARHLARAVPPSEPPSGNEALFETKIWDLPPAVGPVAHDAPPWRGSG